MKTDPIKKGIEEIKKVTMTPTEKQEMLAVLLQHTKLNPVHSKPNFWSAFVSSQTLARRQMVPVLAAVLIFVLAGGTTIFAAEGALPGDLLYSIKININEPVLDTLAVTKTAKAERETTKAERRLTEAEKLALNNRLDEKTRKSIQTKLTKNIQAFNQLEQAIASSTSAEEAMDTYSNFEAKLNAHARILQKFEDRAQSEQKSEVQELQKTIDQNIDKSKDSRKNIETKLIKEIKDKKENSDSDSDFNTRKQTVKKEIKNARKQIDLNMEQSQNIDKEILDDASTTLNNAQQDLNEAEEIQQRTQDEEQAYPVLFSAERKVKEANTSIDQNFHPKKPNSERNQDNKNSKDR